MYKASVRVVRARLVVQLHKGQATLGEIIGAQLSLYEHWINAYAIYFHYNACCHSHYNEIHYQKPVYIKQKTRYL